MPHAFSDAHRALYERIAAHSLDHPDDPIPFSAKLARQNGWTLAYARRVVEEYRRFVFLAVAAGHVATPSDAIDQAWHLHLTCTRNYWECFCPQVLGRPLHHEPGDGSASDDARHAQQYADTLASYRRLFGEDAPTDIWPRVDQHSDFVRLDRARYWLLPRWRPLAAAAQGWQRLAAVLLGTLTLSGCSMDDPASWNVLAYSGPNFLCFYLLAIVGYVVLAILMRIVRRLLDDSDSWQINPKLTPVEAAYLAGGPPRAVGVAMLELAQDNKLMLAGGLNIVNAAPHTPDMTPLQQAILHSASLRTRFVGIGNKAFRPQLDEIAAGLADRHLLAPTALVLAQRRLLRYTALALLLLGAAKIVVGISIHRPVAFLVIILFLFTCSLLIARKIGAQLPPLTKLGRRTVDALRSAQNFQDQSDASLRYRYALLGPAALIGTQMAAMRFALTPQPMVQSGSGSDGSSSCGSSGDGGGSGCGGGGGCGGCGGGGD